MLDINFIRQNQDLVAHSIKEKGYQISLNQILQLDDERKSTLKTVDALRQERNQIAALAKSQKPQKEQIEQGKNLKLKLADLESKLKTIEDELNLQLRTIPNIILPSVPLGGEQDSVEIKAVGEKKSTGVDHLDYCQSRDWVDFERGSKVAGNKFYYLKNELVLIEQALIQFGIKTLLKHGFTIITPPNLVNSRTLEGTGFNPRTSDQSDEYFIEKEDLALIATAEIPLTGYHADEILDLNQPIFYAGLSPCYRKEAGAYGKHTRGLFRVHQFNKLEMYAFCKPAESEAIHAKILAIEEEIYQALEIPYRIINIAAGDLGAPAAKKYDLEYWSPVDQTYREITSCSNCTDFQARRLNIRTRQDDKIITAHTLNGTAISLARAMVALIENHATKNGKLHLPAPLRPYFDHQTEI